MSIDIYFFSVTGNSLHVARELQSRLRGSKLIPIIKLLQQEEIKSTANTIGFVFPNFCLTIPIPLKKFMEKIDCSSSKYIFAICTRGGSPSEANEYLDDLLARQNKKLNAYININMPWNHPLGKKNLIASVSEKMKKEMESTMRSKLDSFSTNIIDLKDYHEEDRDITMKLPLLALAIQKIFGRERNYSMHAYMYERKILFYSDEKCNGCSTCVKVCLNNRIEITNKKPVWENKSLCYGCFTCINYCPQQAIQVKSKFPVMSSTQRNSRYHHPEISPNDIATQK